ncbi:MAG: chromosomal replication initiator protein DnaA [Desulfobacterales bacterium]|nr:chromosomal replication initiator protein DnaA [Desulfobacterales bacterium]
MEAIWEQAKLNIKNVIPENYHKMWIEPIKFNKFENGNILLSCPNIFFQKRIHENYLSTIEEEINKLSITPYKVCLGIEPKVTKPAKEKERKENDNKETLIVAQDIKPVKPQSIQTPTQLLLPDVQTKPNFGRFFRKDFTFDHFIVGSNNDFAYSAALSMASKSNSPENSLFLHSDTGMGKSHLSQAIGNQILKNEPSFRIFYLSAEDFTYEMGLGYKNNNIDQFKEKYRNNCDVLLLEDIHCLAGKEKTQSELAMTLDYLMESKKKIIFSSCYLPSEIPKMSEQLISRLNSSIISNIDPPDFRTRVKILQKKSKIKGFINLSSNIIEYLASELSENVRLLESGLVGVVTKASLLGIPIDLPLVESVIKNLVKKTKAITIDSIKKIVCKEYSVSTDDLISKSRKTSIVRPRQIAMYLSRKYTDQPFQTIGKNFNRYHATAIHSINSVEKDIKAKGPMYKQVEYLCKKIEAGEF